ncbi:hypothetical protein ACIBCM_11745 [Streptomyces sp. NPDC051018]|uniref:hypothetical protein n=1 Tax=Streptomyces sp. NPDC051018 TaxID=3365639 RepID=UPI003792D8F8
MTSTGAPIRVYDARLRQPVSLPRPGGQPLLITDHPVENPEIGAVRAASAVAAWCRLLAWKGYRPRVEPRDPAAWPGTDGCPQGAVAGYCVHLRAPVDGGGLRDSLHLLIGPVQLIRGCRFADWHREGRRVPTLRDLTERGTPAPDLRFAMMMAGHYRHPRRFRCSRLHGDGDHFADARVTRRRLERLVRELEPLPAIGSHTEAGRHLTAEGLRELGRIDGAISDDLHVPRALQALYRALRRGRLPHSDRAVLSAMARRLFTPAAGARSASGHHPGTG